MQYLANVDGLMAEGVLTAEQGLIIKARSRQAMVALAINTLLTGGIAAAALGLVMFLASAIAVAITGALFLAAGVAILRGGNPLYRMFGNAGSLIGAAMLAGGATLELVSSATPAVASLALLVLGAAAALVAGRALVAGPAGLRFIAGSVLLMGSAMHLGGLGIGVTEFGTALPLAYLYTTVVIAAVGVLVDVRAVTAVAIAPFAQLLDTGTAYFHAAYVFYSPEPTLSILQMALLVAGCLWIAARFPPRIGRHAGILAIMGFIVANLCFLVGSLWGDVVGESFWNIAAFLPEGADYETREAVRDAFAARALVISEHVFAVVWAAVLAGAAVWAAHRNRRGLFNAAITFAAIHAYTQFFESFGIYPLAYVIGGLAAIPLAWGVWRLNDRFREASV